MPGANSEAPSSPTTTEAPHPSAPPEQVVAWQRDGALVVIDPATGTVVRTLANVVVRYPGVGPGSVSLTPDGTLAVVSWRTAEPGCWTQVGAVPTDGSGSLIDWGQGGTEPVVSPDGRRVAWLAASSPDCAKQELVVRSIESGSERRIVMADGASSFYGGGGPWWRDDNNTLVFNPNELGNAAPTVLAFDASKAQRRSDAGTIALACFNEGDFAFWARPTPDGAGLIVERLTAENGSTRIELCPFVGAAPKLLFTVPSRMPLARMNRSGTKLLLGDDDGSLSISTMDGTITPLSVGPYYDASW
jgi:hypothetical protein